MRRPIMQVYAPIDDQMTDWRTNPRLCFKLAFLRAHAVMLLARRKLR